MASHKRSTPPLPTGASGLPNLDKYDYEFTSTRQTETNQVLKPASSPSSHPVVSVIAGADAGRVLSISEGQTVTIGRATECDLVLPDAGVSRKHISIRRQRPAFTVTDLGSKNGTFVDGYELRGERRIDIGATIQIGSIVVVRLVLMTETEESLARQLYDTSMRDPLTGTYNRRYLFDRLQAEISFSIRHKSPLSLVVFDIDRFKEVNDTHGHQIGDQVLVQCAKAVAATLRSEDVLARTGGEEFAAVLRGIDHAAALKCAERLRVAVGNVRLPSSLRVTISLGVASVDDCAMSPTPANLFAVADERLYAAKRAGRDCVRGRSERR